MCTTFISLQAQRTITGTVIDEEDEPLIGVNVVAKGSPVGTITDFDGNYSIVVPDGTTQLGFSYIGYIVQSIDIGASNVINVTLIEDAQKLGEVVVTALGIPREKKTLSYAVQEVESEEIANSGETNVVAALTGKVAGVQATSTSGAPGGSANIRIRGSASMTGSNQPLFVIDGVPISNAYNETESGTRGVAYSNRAIDINPEDIANVSVLKGASASALYGSRAANGVILITTKSGKGAGKGLNIEVSSSVGLSTVNKLPDLQTSFSQGIGGAYSGNIRSWGAPVGDLSLDADGNIVPASDETATGAAVPIYNNAEDFFQRGVQFKNFVSLSGGSDRANYYVSFGDDRITGIIPGTDYNKTTVALRGGTSLSDKVRVSGSANFTKSDSRRAQQGSNGGGVALALYRTPPTFDASNGNDDWDAESAFLNEDGSQRNWHPAFNNPYWTINQDPFEDNVNRIIGHVMAEYEPLNWLKFTYRIGNDFYLDSRKQIFAINSANGAGAGQILEDQFNRSETTSDFFINLSHDFNDRIGGELLLGNNLNHRSSQNLFVDATSLTIGDFYNINNASTINSSEAKSVLRTAALFFDAKFDFDDWLFLNVTGRQEWASTFGPQANSSFFYPSVGLGAVFTEPLGLTDNEWLSYGKVRFSYGLVGNQPPVYSTTTVFSSPNITDGYTRPQGIQGPFIGQTLFTQDDLLGNAFLEPERTRSWEIGTDLRFFKNRLSVDFTYFNQLSDKQIFAVPLATSSGFSSIVQNAGEISSKGIEMVIGATPIKAKGFEWDISMNFSRIRNVVEKLAEGVPNIGLGGFFSANGRLVEGEEYGLVYGELWSRDDNGNLIIEQNPNSPNYGKPITEFEEGVIANPNPDWLMGIRNTFSFKGLSLTGLIDIKKGGQLWNGTRGALYSYGTHADTENRGNEVVVFEGVQGTINTDNEVEVTGGDNNVAVVLDENWYRAGNGSGFVGPSEPFVEDAGWVRLRDVTLSYSLPKSIFGKSPFRGVELAVSGRNLLLFTPYSGQDPETNLTGVGNLQGLDYFQMPNTKSYTFSVRLKF